MERFAAVYGQMNVGYFTSSKEWTLPKDMAERGWKYDRPYDPLRIQADDATVEIVARALCDEWMGRPDMFSEGRPHWMTYGKTRIDAVNLEWRHEVEAARAVIKAIGRKR